MAVVLRDRTVPLLSLSHRIRGDGQAAAPESILPDAYVVIVDTAKVVESLRGLTG